MNDLSNFHPSKDQNLSLCYIQPLPADSPRCFQIPFEEFSLSLSSRKNKKQHRPYCLIPHHLLPQIFARKPSRSGGF